ncbi:MATE family efflux transporter [Pelagicoccus mobilis]|uniref:Multidrug-efflux transporter n=1 Tax=Pelagicoccus mobilis TaxID=415221 RepID=A0A934RY36_9BACT|nr:MATE family efflux transporter [Pelagicoccus mobilis]MBK1876946.1 MATE family efflux transporter [Pelagicoccus mobilis]
MLGGDSKVSWPVELKTTLRLAGPIVLGNVGQILIGVVDTLMIGRIGVAPLGAAAFVNNVYVIPLVTLMGVLAAVTILVSQAKGASDERQVGRHIRHGLGLSVFVSVAACLLMTGNGFFLDRYGQEAEVVEAARIYYWLITASLLPALVYHCLKSVWEGLGWSKPPMFVLLSGIGLNIVLNWILIFGELGAPKLGLVGAGIATLIARTAVMVAMFVLTLRAGRMKRFLPRRWMSGFEFDSFKSMLKLGLPMGAQHLFEVGAFAGAGIMIGWLSKEALAAHQIAMSCASMSFMIPLGVSISCGIRVGGAFGAQQFRRIRTIYLSTLGFTFFQTLLAALVFLLGGSWLAEQFVENVEVVGIAASIFMVAGLFQIFDGAQVVSLGALRGMSDVNVPMLITFVAYWVVALPVGYLLGFSAGFGAVGVWIGLAVGLLAAALSLFVRLEKKLVGSR